MRTGAIADGDMDELNGEDWPGEEVTVTHGWRKAPQLFKRATVGDVFAHGTMEMAPAWFAQGNTVSSGHDVRTW